MTIKGHIDMSQVHFGSADRIRQCCKRIFYLNVWKIYLFNANNCIAKFSPFYFVIVIL